MKMSGTRREENKEAALISSYIPTELCEEILHRLPSNDLRNFKLVCKDWLRLISTTRFIQKHLERSNADCNQPKIVLSYNYSMVVLNCANNTSKKISYDDHDHVRLLGCCNGLVLYYDARDMSKITALNPNTGESLVRTLHPSLKDDIPYRSRLIFSWFGHHPSTGDYVLVLANSLRRDHSGAIIILKVYSLSLAHNNVINPVLLSSSTSELYTYINNFYKTKIATLLHGRLHYPASNHFVLVYDFETNKIMRMSPPSPVESGILILGVVDGCLCAIREKQVWMMKEYGVLESWTKYANLYGCALAFCPNGDVIITEKSSKLSRYGVTIADKYSSKLSRYSFKKRGINKILKAYENRIIKEGFACIDSLVSPTSLFREDQ